MAKKIVFNDALPAHLCLQEVEHLIALWQAKQALMCGENLDDGQIQVRIEELRPLQHKLIDMEYEAFGKLEHEDLTTQFSTITRRV